MFFEQQLAEVIGSRVGYVYKTEDDLFEILPAQRPPDVYSVPFPFTDIGVDGVRGTADDAEPHPLRHAVGAGVAVSRQRR